MNFSKSKSSYSAGFRTLYLKNLQQQITTPSPVLEERTWEYLLHQSRHGAPLSIFHHDKLIMNVEGLGQVLFTQQVSSRVRSRTLQGVATSLVSASAAHLSSPAAGVLLFF